MSGTRSLGYGEPHLQFPFTKRTTVCLAQHSKQGHTAYKITLLITFNYTSLLLGFLIYGLAFSRALPHSATLFSGIHLPSLKQPLRLYNSNVIIGLALYLVFHKDRFQVGGCIGLQEKIKIWVQKNLFFKKKQTFLFSCFVQKHKDNNISWKKLLRDLMVFDSQQLILWNSCWSCFPGEANPLTLVGLQVRHRSQNLSLPPPHTHATDI